MLDLPQHSYEEIRETVVDVILGKENVTVGVNQFANLLTGVAEVLGRRRPRQPQTYVTAGVQDRLHPHDRELVRDVFWDLFRQGFITLGFNDSNESWPFFRVSHFGQHTLQSHKPYRFHDTASFLAIVRQEIPDISDEAVAYLDEAVSAFYAGCLLASCVMLGVAAEAEFLRLVDVAAAPDATNAQAFAPVLKEKVVRPKITKFQAALKPILPNLLPKKNFEDAETNFTLIQSVLRIARNEAGHPTGTDVPERAQVYTFLQLFVPFARQLMRLRKALA